MKLSNATKKGSVYFQLGVFRILCNNSSGKTICIATVLSTPATSFYWAKRKLAITICNWATLVVIKLIKFIDITVPATWFWNRRPK